MRYLSLAEALTTPAEFDALLKEMPQISRRILTAVEGRLRFADAVLAARP